MTQTVIHYTDSATFGGAEQVLLHTLSNLDRRRWRPVLFYHPGSGLAPLIAKAQKLNIALRALPAMSSVRDMGRLPEFIRALHAEQPAVFHAHLIGPVACKYGLIAAALTRVPAIVVTAHLCWELPEGRSIYVQPRLVAAGVDRYLAVSAAVVNQLRYPFRIPASKIQLVRNGIPLPPFEQAAAPLASPGLPAGRPVVLTVARLDRQKGHRYLLEAAAQIPAALFVLVGAGPEQANLEAQAQKLGLTDRVLFLGYRDDIPALLARCDLFVLPSLYEGLPLSILEAMAAAKPVIATTVGGNAEAVIDGETGLLVPPANPTALTGAIRRLLSDSLLAGQLGAAGKNRVYREFSVQTMVQSVSQVYEELLDKQQTAKIQHQQPAGEL